jgi:hypothetical protein
MTEIAKYIYVDDMAHVERIKKGIEKNGFIVAAIEVVEINSELRGMSDDEWLKYSHVIEPKTEFSKRGRKPKI